MYNPSLFCVAAQILKGTISKVNGVNKKVYTPGETIFVSAKTYGGTEKVVNGQYVVEDTITIETWYRPDISAVDALKLLDDNSEWEIITSPEDIERRHQYLKFKARRLKGGA